MKYILCLILVTAFNATPSADIERDVVKVVDKVERVRLYRECKRLKRQHCHVESFNASIIGVYK